MKAEDGREFYENIEIPEELSEVVNRAIASKNKEEIQMKHKKQNRQNKTVSIFRYAAAAAAGLLICMTIGVNSSEAFAKEMSDVPVIGALAKVLTVRSYHGTDGDYQIDMEVPEIAETAAAQNGQAEDAGSSAAESTFTGDINAEIRSIVDAYTEQAKAEFEEYKEAFFATGGTEEEWGGRTMDIIVDYEVKYQQGNILSLELMTSKGWVASEEERHYYNLDLSTKKYLTLQDLLGEDYIDLINESVRSQIRERILADESVSYFGFGADGEENPEDSIGGFTTVTADTAFYLNEKGNVVVSFDKYEIAPGYMGFQEFEIAGK